MGVLGLSKIGLLLLLYLAVIKLHRTESVQGKMLKCRPYSLKVANDGKPRCEWAAPKMFISKPKNRGPKTAEQIRAEYMKNYELAKSLMEMYRGRKTEPEPPEPEDKERNSEEFPDIPGHSVIEKMIFTEAAKDKTAFMNKYILKG